jgi:hypothetical protein
MGWTSPLDSRPLRPVPVLWLIVPWTLLLAWTGVLTVRVLRSPPESGPRALFGAIGELALYGIAFWAGAIGLGFTWIWLALAVPGIRRPGLWLAAACYATVCFVAVSGDAASTLGGMGLLCTAASCGAIHSILVARLRARSVWGESERAGV